MFFMKTRFFLLFLATLAGCQGDVASWRPTHTYYINLASAVKNKEFMVRQLDTLGLDYSRFPAHDVPRLGAPRLHEALPPHALPLVDADAWQSLWPASFGTAYCDVSQMHQRITFPLQATFKSRPLKIHPGRARCPLSVKLSGCAF